MIVVKVGKLDCDQAYIYLAMNNNVVDKPIKCFFFVFVWGGGSLRGIIGFLFE